jgi:hypothetical protein
MTKSLFLAGVWLAASCFAAAHAQKDMPPPADGLRHHMQAPKTRAEVEARVKARFAALDANKDGFITPDELHHRGLHRDGPDGAKGADRGADHKARADRMFAMMDTDRNGEIGKAEFEAFHADHEHGGSGGPDRQERFAGWGGGQRHGGMWMMHMRHQIMADRMFDREDANHDGRVSLAEAEKAALDRFDRVDTNHDGVISDAERDAARQQMAARFHEWREHRWGGGWGHRGDAAPPSSGAPAAPQG